MIQRPERGGAFEYVKDVRNADNGEMNYEPTVQVLNGETPSKTLAIDAGALVLFRGRNSMHRVTPVLGRSYAYPGSAGVQHTIGGFAILSR